MLRLALLNQAVCHWLQAVFPVVSRKRRREPYNNGCEKQKKLVLVLQSPSEDTPLKMRPLSILVCPYQTAAKFQTGGQGEFGQPLGHSAPSQLPARPEHVLQQLASNFSGEFFIFYITISR